MFESVSLSRGTLQEILGYAARTVWPSGFNIYQRGTPAEGVFVLIRGCVLLRSRVKTGRGYIPSIVPVGGTFGGEGLAAANPPPARYVTEAWADGETETCHFNGQQFRAFAREQPGLALTLSAQMMAEHAALLERLCELATLSVEQRLGTALARMAQQRTFVDGEGRLALDAARYRVLCEMVGATRESVSLVLNRLVARGAATRKEGQVLVDVDALAAPGDTSSMRRLAVNC